MSEKFLAEPLEVVTWINGKQEEPRLRRLARYIFRRPYQQEEDFQSFIPAQDIPALRQTNPELADILEMQLEQWRSDVRSVALPVVQPNGDILITWGIPKEPLKVEFTADGIIDRSQSHEDH